ncbi:MAG TPA: rhodanese-like domain-containing protein [Gemmatimonadaceae bacterium]|nr:rhodanese-like domain-containing protein [Gemmatimonadaceae bacterium]
MKTYEELLADAKSRVQEMGVKDAMALRHTTGDTVFLDVRDPQEYNLGKIPGAITISRGNLEKNVEAHVPREKTVVIYCANGNRSALAADTLRTMGYEHVRSLREGFSGWVAEGGDVE